MTITEALQIVNGYCQTSSKNFIYANDLVLAYQNTPYKIGWSDCLYANGVGNYLIK